MTLVLNPPDALILPLLEKDRVWTAYALGDLDPPYRENARVLADVRNGAATAMILEYKLPATVALLPYGEVDGVRTILLAEANLPEMPFFIMKEQHVPALEERYRIDVMWQMWRMRLRPAGFATSTSLDLPVRRLGAGDGEMLREFYGTYAEKVFDLVSLDRGVYFGAFDGAALVAAAGTHVVSRVRKLAAIGSVFTLPEYRGKGLAKATTSAVCEALTGKGIELLVLNVREDNEPAIRAYLRLGFQRHLLYREGHATLCS
ncbi:MAG: GNAT family N-acetyltransferase [Chloroflexota bacterium]